MKVSNRMYSLVMLAEIQEGNSDAPRFYSDSHFIPFWILSSENFSFALNVNCSNVSSVIL